MHKLIALIIGAIVAYIVNGFIGESRSKNIVSIIIGVIVALIIWAI